MFRELTRECVFFQIFSISVFQPLNMQRLLLLIPLLLLIGCGAQMRNMPVGEGQMQASASIGGPLVNAFGNVIPVPYAMAGATYGLTDRAEIHADLHVLAAAYKFLGFTPGATYFPELPLGQWVSAVTGDVLIFSDLKATRAYPEILLTMSRPIGTRWIPFAGLHNTFQFSHSPVYISSVYAGTSYRVGRWKLYGELEWLALNRDNHFTPVDYHGISEHGALSPQFGVTLDLGGKK
jgi:hypothetical protein